MTETASLEARRATVLEAVRGFPDSVVPAVWVVGAPRCVALGTLVSAEQLAGRDPVADAVLAKFVRRLREARPDLSEGELLELSVPAASGDQEVFLARLGKWRFELRQLEEELARAEP